MQILERSITCVFGCVAFLGALFSPLIDGPKENRYERPCLLFSSKITWNGGGQKIEKYCPPAGTGTEISFGGVPTTPDPNTAAKGSQDKGSHIMIQIGVVLYYFLPRGGHTCAQVSR